MSSAVWQCLEFSVAYEICDDLDMCELECPSLSPKPNLAVSCQMSDSVGSHSSNMSDNAAKVGNLNNLWLCMLLCGAQNFVGSQLILVGVFGMIRGTDCIFLDINSCWQGNF